MKLSADHIDNTDDNQTTSAPNILPGIAVVDEEAALAAKTPLLFSFPKSNRHWCNRFGSALTTQDNAIKNATKCVQTMNRIGTAITTCYPPAARVVFDPNNVLWLAAFSFLPSFFCLTYILLHSCYLTNSEARKVLVRDAHSNPILATERVKLRSDVSLLTGSVENFRSKWRSFTTENSSQDPGLQQQLASTERDLKQLTNAMERLEEKCNDTKTLVELISKSKKDSIKYITSNTTIHLAYMIFAVFLLYSFFKKIDETTNRYAFLGTFLLQEGQQFIGSLVAQCYARYKTPPTDKEHKSSSHSPSHLTL